MDTNIVWIIRICFILFTGLTFYSRAIKRRLKKDVETEDYMTREMAKPKLRKCNIVFDVMALLAVISFAASIWFK